MKRPSCACERLGIRSRKIYELLYSQGGLCTVLVMSVGERVLNCHTPSRPFIGKRIPALHAPLAPLPPLVTGTSPGELGAPSARRSSIKP